MHIFDLDVLAVVSVGFLILVGLACLIGWLESYARRRAWRDIARARRAAAERSRRLDEREWVTSVPPHPDRPPNGS